MSIDLIDIDNNKIVVFQLIVDPMKKLSLHDLRCIIEIIKLNPNTEKS